MPESTVSEGLLISVVIPARDRPVRLLQLLAALERQTLPAQLFEVIVADDGSTVPLWDSVLAQYPASALQLRFVRLNASRGPAAARNLGARVAQSDIIAFTDDDCLPDAGWLQAICNAFVADAECAAVEGHTHVPLTGRETPYTIQMKGLMRPGGFQTCNFAVRADDFARVGGFDERFDKPHREDTDFAFALLSTRRSIRFLADAVVVHPLKGVPPLQVELKRILWSRYDLLLWSKYRTLYRAYIGELAPLTLLVGLIGWLVLIFSNGPKRLIGAGIGLAAGGYIASGRLRGTEPTMSEVARVLFVSTLWALLHLAGLALGLRLVFSRKRQ